MKTKTKTLFKTEKLRAKINKKENVIIVEANWEDPDNTEEWFCHLENVIFHTFILGKLYTYDMKWCLITYDCLTFTLCNTTYNASVTFTKEALLKAILTN